MSNEERMSWLREVGCSGRRGAQGDGVLRERDANLHLPNILQIVSWRFY